MVAAQLRAGPDQTVQMVAVGQYLGGELPKREGLGALLGQVRQRNIAAEGSPSVQLRRAGRRRKAGGFPRSFAMLANRIAASWAPCPAKSGRRLGRPRNGRGASLAVCLDAVGMCLEASVTDEGACMNARRTMSFGSVTSAGTEISPVGTFFSS